MDSHLKVCDVTLRSLSHYSSFKVKKLEAQAAMRSNLALQLDVEREAGVRHGQPTEHCVENGKRNSIQCNRL